MKRLLKQIGMLISLLVFSELADSQALNNFISNQVQSQISRQISTGISKNLNENLLIPLLNVRNKSGEVKNLTLSSDERFFNVLHQDGSVRIWDTKQGVQKPVIRADNLRFTNVVSGAIGNLAYLGASDGKVYIYDIYTSKPLKELDAGTGAEVKALSLSQTENRLAAAYADGKILIWDLKKAQKSATLSLSSEQDVSSISFAGNEKSLLISYKDGNSELWDADKAKKTVSLPKASGKSLGFWENTASEWLSIDSDANVQTLTASGASLGQAKKLPGISDSLSAATLSFSKKLISVAGTANKIQLFNLSDFTLQKEIPTKQPVQYLRFINQGKHLLGADEAGLLHVWDVMQGSEVVQLISTTTGWTVIDNSGRFDSSEKGMTNVSWQAGDQDIPLDSFSGNYYEPDLLATVLNNDNFINKTPQKIQEGINLPPVVSLSIPGSGAAGDEIQINFEIVDGGGGIGEHRLYQNGKIIDPSNLTDTQDTEVNDVLHRKITYKAVLSSGSNKFKVVAANKMGIESLVQQQSVLAAGAEKLPNLYVLVIGINKYTDHNLDLSYSVQDARSIVSTIGEKNTTGFKNIFAYDLLDQAATKEGIISKLGSIAENAKANDVLILYFAGHGIAVKGEWYFLPHETVFHPEEDYYAQVGVAAQQIRELISKIPAEKILVMFDSCYSGSGIKVFENLKKTQRHFSRSLSKNDGIVVLAATRKDQEALELSELGHGLFTYIVTAGMMGAADNSPLDKHVSAHEVVDYASDNLPSYTRKYANASQEPTAFTIGDDFMLLGL